jgi:hypothetical protein
MSDAADIERMRILERIERGEINAAEGMRLLDQLTDSMGPLPNEPVSDMPGGAAGSGAPLEEDIAQWKRWWMVPFAVGVGIMTVAALLMLSAIQASGYGFWFYCLWLPFLAGVAVMVLAWASRTARWLHLRVHTGQDEWPRNIAISFPIPIRFTAWLLRMISPYVPRLRDTALDELVLALNDTTSSQTPFYVDVAEGKGGERVQIYLG